MAALGSLCGGRTKDNEHKLKQDRFRLDVQKIFSTTKTFKLPQNAEMSPSLEVFKLWSDPRTVPAVSRRLDRSLLRPLLLPCDPASTDKHHFYIILTGNQYQNMLTHTLQLALLYLLTVKKRCKRCVMGQQTAKEQPGRASRCRS